ncbi:hypothetical protein FDP41_011226 [Naegleria fowleri]|uniref:Uncharacterized protein n=1 Tax=Naegleria fowleri TaxID=5763 RepID=A0A6A5C3I3_NAEFO|nr:uncharacterized protein FDP41_011226 [Naegleria fowleri]KAF0982296.1 hypothetical protein FDP41_011226 [Naegleria fowleri]CAG4711132.1 unnamed protein product [Naegleria fowleri]
MTKSGFRKSRNHEVLEDKETSSSCQTNNILEREHHKTTTITRTSCSHSSSSSLSSRNNHEEINVKALSSLLQQTPYFIHGSQDSLDVDLIYMFTAHSMPSHHKECCWICFDGCGGGNVRNDSTMKITMEEGSNPVAHHNIDRSGGDDDDDLNVMDNSGVIGHVDRVGDVNLFEIVDDQTPSYVRRVFRGLPDEVNNGLFKTLKLHSQKYEHIQPIKGMVKRVAPLKCVMTLQNILVKIRRCEQVRSESILALKSFDLTSRMQMLKNLDFTKIVNKLEKEDLKYLAFRLSQTVALVEGFELYTKKEIVEYDRNLKNVIYRFEGIEKLEDEKLRSAQILNEYLKKLLQYMDSVKSTKMKNFEILTLKKNSHQDNLFSRQCHHCAVKQHMYCCEVLHYPRDYDRDSIANSDSIAQKSNIFSIHMFVDFDTDKLYIFEDTLENTKIVKSVTSLVVGKGSDGNHGEVSNHSKKSKHISTVTYSSVKDNTLKGLDFSKYFFVFRFDSKAKKLTVEFMRERATNEQVAEEKIRELTGNWTLK